ncbi:MULTISPECIES: type II toxin-antitoxin system RelE/ParE family toxin [Nitrospirillum]|uniref:Plasmid stabilization system protein ParE n=1 Tax=Nitrospirillum amazonense TaxID=28077 RepID=A0A560GD75_9PROT|nr:type II toxin-antitoxin system RelE/ParE family toxin [Nitrospirillum amazonense]MEC4591873.1 type II toxin-antitoxin system RelE/ParE family toxin [Nitrospirillum amazonense]TWB31855.1 plasmid stabilization system protein ParE [Nitrospirillum amazonense]
MRVVWSVPALRDVIGHRAYIAQFNPIAATDIAQRLAAAGDSLKTFPRRGRPGSKPGTREVTVIYPYVIVYKIEDDRVLILRVWHGSQER